LQIVEKFVNELDVVYLLVLGVTAAIAAVPGEELFGPSRAAGIDDQKSFGLGLVSEAAEMLHLPGVAAAAVKGENDRDQFRSVIRAGHMDKVRSLSLSDDESACVIARGQWGVSQCHCHEQEKIESHSIRPFAPPHACGFAKSHRHGPRITLPRSSNSASRQS